MVRTVKKPEERRADIINAARYLFETREYENTTMQDVMNHLGIAKGTIYYYFTSKEELLEAVINDMVDENTAAMQNILDQAGGNAIDKIRLLVQAGNMAGEHEELLEQLHRPGNMGMHARGLAVALLKQAPLYAQLIEEGNQSGLFNVEHPLEAAEFILTSVQFLTDTGFYPWTPESLMRRAAALPVLIENLLKAQPGSFDFLTPPTPANGSQQ